MVEKLEKILIQLQETKDYINSRQFYEITMKEIDEIEDSSELKKEIECLFKIRDISTSLIRVFAHIQYQAVEYRKEAERCFDIKQKALQEEELIFLRLILFFGAGFYYFFHDFRVFLAQLS